MDYDELDREIDEEMGWTENLKKKQRRTERETRLAPGTALLAKLHFPKPFARALKASSRAAAKVLFFPLISPLGHSKTFNVDGDLLVVKRSWRWRLGDALLTRLVLTPVIVTIFLIGVVYASTHPQRIRAVTTPETLGVYFKRVRLVAVDGQGLGGWYLPPITADELAFDPESSLAQKWPAVVICHGLGATHEQYLGLAQELHREGFAVLMLDTRGQGESDAGAVTYGLRERLDVLAGVKYLRDMPNLDSGKICVVGHDISASAALQAASLDSSIAAAVADGIWPQMEDRARTIFSHPGGKELPLNFLAPLYTAIFEIAIRDRQLDPEAVARNIHTQPVLFVARHGAHYAAVEEVMQLATCVGSHHEVIIAEDHERTTNPYIENRISNFLVQSIGWKGPHARGLGELQKLLDKRVK